MIERSNIKMSRHNFDTKDFIDNYIYEGSDLGANYANDKTIFKVWAPTAENVELCLYKYGSEEEAGDVEEDLLRKISMNKESRGIWAWEENGDIEGVYYTFLVTVDGVTRETADPYS